MKPEICPICNGRGTIPESFYTGYQNTTTAGELEVTCKSCMGCGYILCPEG